MAITVTAVRTPRRESRFDLFADIASALSRSGARLADGDVLVISSKYVAVSQGRAISESRLSASSVSRKKARDLGMREAMAEAVLRESEDIIGGAAGFAMARAGGVMAPNAGLDTSNAQAGQIILYPDEPRKAAEQVRRKALLEWGARIGVIIADSRLMPMRAGTCGVALASAGFEPVEDRRGRADLGGRPLAVTKVAAADSIATMANYEMGEGSESTPLAIVRGARVSMSHGAEPAEQVTEDECVYARSMRDSPRRG